MIIKRSKPDSPDDLIAAERTRIINELTDAPAGRRREELIRELGQLAIAANVDKWAASSGLQSPK